MRTAPPPDSATPRPGGGAPGPDPAALLGRVLGPYLVVRHLGSGGMGAVFLAEHPALHRKVAVKVLTADRNTDPLAVERFHREARAAAALDHPHIVRLFDMGAADGLHYLVLEYVEGADLQTALDRGGPLPYREAVAAAAQAAAGLQHAHERGFIHRDVKPANLIRAADGGVKVLDMGLARPLADGAPDDRLTRQLPGECIVGTTDYLSPEQAMNAPLDPRTDVYSLGATLYALVAGTPPFAGSTVQKLTQVQFKEPPRLDAAVPGVPAELADAVARMLAKRPADRFQSAAEVVVALSPWLPPDLLAALGADPNTRRSLSRVIPLARRRARRRRVAGALCAVAAVALVGAVLAWRPWAGGPQPDPTAAAVTRLRALDAHRAQVNDVAFAPDGRRLASTDTAGRVVVWDVRTGQRLFTTPRAGPDARVYACATTPHGRLLTGGSGQPVVAYDWATGAKVREYETHVPTVTGLAVSPDGRHLAVSGVHGDVGLLDLATGAEVRRFSARAGIVWAVAFTPDGSKLVAGTGRSDDPDGRDRVVAWDAATGRELHRLAGHAADVRAVDVGPDGRTLASGGFDGVVRVWDLETGRLVRHWTAHEGYVERVQFLDVGRRLLTCGGPGEGDRVDGGSVVLWNPDTGDAARAWRGPEWTGLVSLAASADGAALAAGNRDGLVRLWPITLDP